MGIFKTIKYIFIALSIALALSPIVMIFQGFSSNPNHPFSDNMSPILIGIVGLVVLTFPISALWVFFIKRKIKKSRSGGGFSDIGSSNSHNDNNVTRKTVNLMKGEIIAVVENSAISADGEIVYGFIEERLKEINNGAWHLNFGSLAGYIKDFKNGNLEFTMDGKPLKVDKIEYIIRKDRNGKWYLSR